MSTIKKFVRALSPARTLRRRPTRLAVQALEDRAVPALIVYEPFNYYLAQTPESAQYDSSTLMGQGLNTASSIGLTGSYENRGMGDDQLILGNLAYPGSPPAAVDPIGNMEMLSSAVDIGLASASQFGDHEGAVTRWVSVLVQPQFDETGGYAGLRLMNTNNSASMILGFGDEGGAKYRAKNFEGLGTLIYEPTVHTPQPYTTVHLVAEIVFNPSGTEIVRSYINPGFGTSPAGGSLLATETGVNYGSITRIGSANDRNLFLDEVRIAATFEGLWADPVMQGKSRTLAAADSDPRTNGEILLPSIMDATRGGSADQASGVVRHFNTGNSGNIGMVRFGDLSAEVPINHVITSAKVVLTPWQGWASSALTSMNAYEITSDWTEINGQTPSLGASVVATGNGAATGHVVFDVTTLAQSWLANPATNFGVAIESPGNIPREFYSHEHGYLDAVSGYYLGIADRPVLVLITAPAPAPVRIVDNDGDIDDANYGVGELTLREAINLSNAYEGPDTIKFGFAAPTTIALIENLPNITDSLTIDGTAQDITIDAFGVGGNILSITFSAPGSTLKDFRIDRASTTAVYISASGVTLDRLNLSDPDKSYSGDAGVIADNADQLTIKNSLIYNKQYGIQVTNSDDLIVTDNDLAYSDFGLYLNTIGQSSLPHGPMAVSGNIFVGTTQRVLWIDNIATGLTISDGSVANSDIVIADGELAGSGSDVFYFNNIPNLLIDGVDASFAGGGASGTGIRIFNSAGVVIQNVDVSGRVYGIDVQGGNDVQLLNSDLSGTDYGITFDSIGQNVLPNGPIVVAGNTHGSKQRALSINNIATGLTVSDGSVANSDVVIADGQLATSPGGSDTLHFSYVPNLLIDGVDVSYTGSGTSGTGIRVNYSDGVVIRNVDVSGHSNGVAVTGGNDVQLLDSDLSGTDYGITFDSIGQNVLPNGPVVVTGNTHGSKQRALRIDNIATGLTVSDGSVANSDVVIPDGQLAGSRGDSDGALFFYNVPNLLIDGVDVSFSDGSTEGAGIRVNYSNGVVIQNVDVSGHGTGVAVFGGNDVQLLDSDLSETKYGIIFQSIGQDLLPHGPIVVSGNTYSSTQGTLLVESFATSLTVSDGSVANSDIVIADGQLATSRGEYYGVLYFNAITGGVAIDNVDVSWGGFGRPGVGMSVYNSDATIDNVSVSNRNVGIGYSAAGNLSISNATLYDNDIGLQSNADTHSIANSWITGNGTGIYNPGVTTLIAENNFWGGDGQPVTDGGTGDSYFGVVDADPFLTGVPNGVAARFVVTTASDVADGDTSSIAALTRNRGADNLISLREAILAANNTPGADAITFAIGTGAQTIVLASALPDIDDALAIYGNTQPGYTTSILITIDASAVAAGSPVRFVAGADNSSFIWVNIIGVTTGAALTLSAVDGVTVGGLILSDATPVSGTGLKILNSSNVTVDTVVIENRTIGIDIANSSTVVVAGSFLKDNATGVAVSGASFGINLAQNWFQGQGPDNAVVNSTAPNVSVLAENNYWSAASGPIDLGGTGDGYTGTVDASPFLIGAPSAHFPSAFEVTTFADVVDGDTSSIANLLNAPGADNAISLREAILAANNTPGADTITFRIGSLGSAYTIALTSGLPAITGEVVIDGDNLGGSGGRITLDANFAGFTVFQIEGSADNSIIRDFAITRSHADPTIRIESGADDVTLLNIDMPGTVGIPIKLGTGISGNGADRLVIDNVDVNWRNQGILIDGGSDVTVINCDLTNNDTSLILSGILNNGGLANGAGILAKGNTFHNSSNAIELNYGISDLQISGTDGPAVDIYLPASAGLATVTGYVFFLRNLDNSTLTGLDLSCSGPTRSGTGIYSEDNFVDSSDNLVIDSVSAANRLVGIHLSGGSDATVTNNILTNCDTSLILSSIADNGGLANGAAILAKGNTFHNSSNAIELNYGISGLQISGTDGPAVDIYLPASAGLATVTGTVFFLRNIDNSTLTGLDLSYSGPTRSGIGIVSEDNFLGSSDNLVIDSVLATNRSVGISLGGGSDATVTNNTLTNCGTSLVLSSIVDNGGLANGAAILVKGNTFHNSGNAIELNYGINNLQVSGTDGPAVDIYVPASAGLTTVADFAFLLRDIDDSTFTGIDVSFSGTNPSGYGIYSEYGADNLVLDGVLAANRSLAVALYGNSVRVLNSVLQNNGTAFATNAGAIGAFQHITNSIIAGNSTGVRNDGSSTILAELNWWGDASGPLPLGTGDSYSGDVDADPWLTSSLGGPTFDFGDAPASYPVLLADNGARHTIGGPTLGTLVDAEVNGQPSADATLDDILGFADDEDGVFTFTIGQVNASLTINPQSVGVLSRIDAWIDFNGDGDWHDIDEKIIDSVAAIAAGPQVFTFDVPAAAVLGTTFLRVRIAGKDGNLAPFGAADVGEVEDHAITILGDAPTPVITAVSPYVGPVAGYSITLTGTGFAGATEVVFDGVVQISIPPNVSNTTIIVTAPPHAAGFSNFTVTAPGGSTTSTSTLGVDRVEYEAAPTVLSIDPVIGPTTGGTLVTIIGTNFAGTTSVTFDGFNAATFTVISRTQINAVTAARVGVGAVEVVVTNTAGFGSLAGTNDFTFVPSVSSVVVNGGPGIVFGASTFSLAGQHSVVRQLLVTFQEAVTVASDAFTVTRRVSNVTVNGGAAPSTVAVVANSVTTISASEYLVTFTGEGTHAGGVINSGVYDLTTLASKVTVGAQAMAANQTTTFFALFGNIEANNRYNGVPITQPIPQAGYSSGNGLTKAFVDPGSLFRFSDTFGSNVTDPVGPPAYDIVFDYNLDGAIDPGDLFAFSDSFGIDWVF